MALLAAPGCSKPVSVVLLTIDTLRADHLSVYGYERSTGENIARVARDGVTFTRAFTTAPKTSPAYASMFTGLYPYRHGVIRLGQELAAENATLAELLAAAGHRSAGFVSSTVMINRLSRLGQGFGHWDDRMTSRERFRENYERDAARTVDQTLDWLGGLDAAANGRLFLFLHLIDPHGPYTPPARFGRRFRGGGGPALEVSAIPDFQRLPGARTLGEYVDAYDAEIAYADAELGRVIADLRERGIYDDALVIITSDHGESLGEDGHYFRHGKTLHEVSTRIPLIVKPPGGRRAGVPPALDDVVSLVDVLPTALDYAGVKVPDGLDGVSLRPAVEGGALDGDRIVFSQRITRNGVHRAAHGRSATVTLEPCPETDGRGGRRCTRTIAGGAADGGIADDVVLRDVLRGFAETASAYRLPFQVTWRYRPGDKAFVRRFIAEHNSAATPYDADDLQALQSLGYFN